MTDISNNPRIGQTTTQHIQPGKSYGTGKKEGTSGEPTLKQWYDGYDDASGHHIQGAKAFFDSVQNGTHQLTPEEQQGWTEFKNEYQWANGQLFGQGGGGWDPNAQGAGGPGGNGGPQVGQTNDFGGELGPDGNYMYDTPGGKTQIGFTGDQTRNDIYGDDNQLILDMPSAKVSCEVTQDHGQDVLKVIVKTSHGTAAYYYSDYKSPNFKLDIQTINPDAQVTGLPIDGAAGVTSNKYDPVKASQPPTSQSDVEGSPVTDSTGKTVENAFYYEAATVDQTINFRPTAGTNETHYVVGNSTISIPVSSEATVSQGPLDPATNKPTPFTSPDGNTTYDYKIEVKHKDGSTDTFYVQKDFTVNINGMNSKIHWDKGIDFDGDGTSGTLGDVAVAFSLKPGDVPIGMQNVFQINGATSAAAAGGGATGDYPKSITDLATYTGATPEDIVAAIKSVYISAPADDAGFKTWLEANFPPATPDQNFLTVLGKADPTLTSALESIKGQSVTDPTASAIYTQIKGRLENDLKMLYPTKTDIKVSNDEFSLSDGTSMKVPTLTFDGKKYVVFGNVNENSGTFPKDFGPNYLIWADYDTFKGTAQASSDINEAMNNLSSSFNFSFF